MKNLQELLALHYVYPLTFNKFQQLEGQVGSIQNIIHLSSINLAKILSVSTKNAEKILYNYKHLMKVNLKEAYNSANINVIPYFSEYYPKKLLEINNAPTMLYAKGDIALLKCPLKLAIIGSRKATNYSRLAMDYIVPPLIEQNCVIVSGLAKGADSLAHTSTIKYGGKTIAVLGHGLFHIYPKENKQLAEEIAENHLLLTEYPPYVGVQKWHFPSRNRIISGISDALIVTEAALKSGTLITTELALESGKDVFAVPGPIHSQQSMGTNSLIKEGAIPIWNGHQIIEEMKMFFRK
ncbi:DNA-processing protein DprA [Lysinibacillus antri]|uniref:DNA-protecting protein DprA n=1 Tax=Lysinibacillus antri TaxID=2498145 RepID=A0A432LHD1_9BACI|nr:DNA-processing protein DprA [Lysinibacillus antri]RUL55818.1 DNA-protecting protein DprA [Lysinibacillus antri]